MKTTVRETDFIEAFRRMNRHTGWSIEGLRSLYEYLCDMEDGIGEEMELDVIGLCCDYTEYDSPEEYVYDRYARADADEILSEYGEDESDELIDYIRDGIATIIEVPNGHVIVSTY